MSKIEIMKNSWSKLRFSDFVSINPKVELKSGEQYSFVEMKDLNENRKKVYSKQSKRLKGGSRFQNKDTLFARITPCLENGKICQVDNLHKGRGFGSTEFLVFRGKEGISESNFVYYLSKWSEVNEFAQLNMTGTSGRQRVSKEAFNELTLTFPSLPEQKAIAEVLSSLDDKIDLLHRQNKTLEEMGQALFRKWFVEEADEDWEVRSLYDSIELIGGGTPKTSVGEYWNGDVKWLSCKDVAANHKGIIVSSEKSITGTGLKNSSAKVLPKFSTVISARGTVGKYCILSEPMAFSQSNYGIKPKFKDCYFFTYLLTNYLVQELQSAAYGSVFDTITTHTFKNTTIALPEVNIIFMFEESVKPFFLKMVNNQFQVYALEKLRDTLLPKLMSGKVRVGG